MNNMPMPLDTGQTPPRLLLKPGRVDGKNSEHRSWGFIPKKLNNEIEVLLQKNKDKAAYKDKKVGQGTQDKRRTVIKGFFADLLKMRNPRYDIRSVNGLKQKHLKAVFQYLESQGQSPSTIQNKISIMRVFCGWIGKHGMIGDSANYVEDKASVKRSMVVQEDKSWDGHGLDLMTKLPEIACMDPHAALWLEQCWAFGLRVKEAIMMRPHIAEDGPYLNIREGTKGGRSRIVPIENLVQRDVLERSKVAADQTTGFLGQRGKTYQQKVRRFYYVLECCGITLKEEGVTAHGLRHQYMHEAFLRLTGEPAPIRGGDLRNIETRVYRIASGKLMERAGHTRVTIGAGYYGSRRVKAPRADNEQGKSGAQAAPSAD